MDFNLRFIIYLKLWLSVIFAGEEDGEEGKQTGVQTGETDAGEADGWLKSKCSGYEALIGFLRA